MKVNQHYEFYCLWHFSTETTEPSMNPQTIYAAGEHETSRLEKGKKTCHQSNLALLH